MSANTADNPRNNNFRFRNEEDALYHASRVAQLKIGSYGTYRDAEGLHNGIVIGFNEYGKVKMACYDPEDGGFTCIGVPPAAIIFDNMPAERTDAPLALEAAACEDDEWDGAGPADDFPRT